MQNRNSNGEPDSNLRSQWTLVLNQANETLTEVLATRRAIDTKIYGLTALATALLSLLATIRPLSFGACTSMWLTVSTLIVYLVIIGLGLREYSPTGLAVFDAHAIAENLDQPYENLMKWTSECLLDYVKENCAIVDKKVTVLSRMLWLFLFSMVLLVASALLY